MTIPVYSWTGPVLTSEVPWSVEIPSQTSVLFARKMTRSTVGPITVTPKEDPVSEKEVSCPT